LPKTVVIIPTYNERRNVELLIPKLFDSIKDCHVLIVDDNSPDGTGEFLQGLNLPNLHVLSRKSKLGLGSAYLDGFEWVMDNLDPGIVIQMDADFSHDVKLLPKMAKLIEDGYDLVVASRYVEGGGVEGWPVHRDMISKGANSLARMMLGLKVKDATSGFKAWSKRAIVNILESHLSSKGFEYQIESILVTSRASMKIIELPYTFVDRQTGKSKLSTKDMLAFAVSVLRMAGRG
jgi:dolichol-phosphate mannosyltransferase